jgi:hypothetical protein
METIIPALLYLASTMALLCIIGYVWGYLNGTEHKANQILKQIHDDEQ